MSRIHRPSTVWSLSRAVLFVAAFVTLIPISVLARSNTFAGLVVSVRDGDTIMVVRRGHAEKVRLAGIDCPELGQAFGARAKQFTAHLALSKTVTVRVRDIDEYGQRIGVVILPDGRTLNRELVAAGMAWRSGTSPKKDRELARLEAEARRAKRGLWTDAHPTPPWTFRKVSRADQ
jgi:endonuclease YncB( thermonuclease family)